MDPERKREMLHDLFGDGNQTIAYFKNGRDSRFSKIEILADYFNVPIDMLREGTRYTYNSNEVVLSADEKLQQATDKQTIQLLEGRIKLLEEALSIKEERINLLIEKSEFYKSQVDKASQAQ